MQKGFIFFCHINTNLFVSLKIKYISLHKKRQMHKAGVLGIDIDKKLMSNFESGNTLLFRWYGANSYLFSLYDHPVTKEVKQDILSLHQFILYNDSVVFESYGGYPSGRGFPDRNNYH